MKTPQRQMVWTRETAHASFVRKGDRVDDVKRAAKKFAREWHPGKASPCDCGPIANGNDE